MKGIEKKEVQEEKKTEIKKSLPENEIDLDLLDESLARVSKSKKLKIGSKEVSPEKFPKITIRKLMAVREMFELKTLKKPTKKSLAKLVIEALEQVK